MESMPSGRPVPIVGEWKLVSFEIRGSDGEVTHPFRKDAQRSLVYTESGRYSAQVMRVDRPRLAAGDQLKGTSEEIKANFEGFISYYGPYEFNAEHDFVIHHVEGSLFPNWEGTEQKRFFELVGDRLTLSTPPTLWGGGGEITGVLVWERME